MENGYVNQFHITRREREDTLTVCERLQAQGSPHVGKANVFVSWFLDTPTATLLDALANFLEPQWAVEHGVEPRPEQAVEEAAECCEVSSE